MAATARAPARSVRLDAKLGQFFKKNAVIAGALTFLLTSFVRQGIGGLTDALFVPLERLDLNDNGESDFSELSRWEVRVLPGAAPMPVGKALIEILKNAFGACTTLVVLVVLLETTDLVVDDDGGAAPQQPQK